LSLKRGDYKLVMRTSRWCPFSYSMSIHIILQCLNYLRY